MSLSVWIARGERFNRSVVRELAEAVNLLATPVLSVHREDEGGWLDFGVDEEVDVEAIAQDPDSRHPLRRLIELAAFKQILLVVSTDGFDSVDIFFYGDRVEIFPTWDDQLAIVINSERDLDPEECRSIYRRWRGWVDKMHSPESQFSLCELDMFELFYGMEGA